MKKIILFLGVMSLSLVGQEKCYAENKTVKGQAELTDHPGGGKDLNCPFEGTCYTINEEEGLITVYLPGGPKIYGYVTPPILIQNPDQVTYTQLGSVLVVEQP